MQSLLRWGIENSDGTAHEDGSQPRPLQNLDPGIIDAILGRPDAELMKEALAVAVDEAKEEEARLAALDDFEMVSDFCSLLVLVLNEHSYSNGSISSLNKLIMQIVCLHRWNITSPPATVDSLYAHRYRENGNVDSSSEPVGIKFVFERHQIRSPVDYRYCCTE